MNPKRRLFAGCFIAPLVAPLILLIVILISGEDLRGPSYHLTFGDIPEILGIALMFVVLGAPIAYLVMALVGLPLYALVKKVNAISFLSVTLGGAFTAMVPIFLMSAPTNFVLYPNGENSAPLLYLTFAACGFCVGVVFWLITARHEATHNKAFHSDGSRAARENRR
jgi:hypothetical protein